MVQLSKEEQARLEEKRGFIPKDPRTQREAFELTTEEDLEKRKSFRKPPMKVVYPSKDIEKLITDVSEHPAANIRTSGLGKLRRFALGHAMKEMLHGSVAVPIGLDASQDPTLVLPAEPAAHEIGSLTLTLANEDSLSDAEMDARIDILRERLEARFPKTEHELRLGKISGNTANLLGHLLTLADSGSAAEADPDAALAMGRNNPVTPGLQGFLFGGTLPLAAKWIHSGFGYGTRTLGTRAVRCAFNLVALGCSTRLFARIRDARAHDEYRRWTSAAMHAESPVYAAFRTVVGLPGPHGCAADAEIASSLRDVDGPWRGVGSAPHAEVRSLEERYRAEEIAGRGDPLPRGAARAALIPGLAVPRDGEYPAIDAALDGGIVLPRKESSWAVASLNSGFLDDDEAEAAAAQRRRRSAERNRLARSVDVQNSLGLLREDEVEDAVAAALERHAAYARATAESRVATDYDPVPAGVARIAFSIDAIRHAAILRKIAGYEVDFDALGKALGEYRLDRLAEYIKDLRTGRPLSRRNWEPIDPMNLSAKGRALCLRGIAIEDEMLRAHSEAEYVPFTERGGYNLITPWWQVLNEDSPRGERFRHHQERLKASRERLSRDLEENMPERYKETYRKIFGDEMPKDPPQLF